MQSDADFEAMMAGLAGNRLSMPAQAAAAQRQLLLEAIQKRKAAMQQGGMGSVERAQRSLPELLAEKRNREYTTLLDPGVTRGLPNRAEAPVDEVSPELASKRAQLVAAMNARTAGIQNGAITPKRRAGDEQVQADDLRRRAIQASNRAKGLTIEQRKELREKLMMGERSDMAGFEHDQFRNRAAQTAFARGRLGRNAQAMLAQQGMIPDMPQQQANRAAMIAMAANAGKNKSDALQEELARQLRDNPRGFWLGYRGNDIGAQGGGYAMPGGPPPPGAFDPKQAPGLAPTRTILPGVGEVLQWPDGRIEPIKKPDPVVNFGGFPGFSF